MKFIPAIDLKDNKCVRLQKGREDRTTIFNEDPVAQALFFEKNGCDRIHLVDLDGAFGRENINKESILKIRKAVNIQIELGGGIKNEYDISYWLKKGIDFLVVGSLAIKNKDLILKTSEKYKEKIYVALDILNDRIMIKGWTEDSNLYVDDIFNFYNLSLINGFILTDISRDGMLKGLDINLIKKSINKTKKKIIVGGGLSNYNDLINLISLKNQNLEGVIAGKAFYSGNILVNKALSLMKNNA